MVRYVIVYPILYRGRQGSTAQEPEVAPHRRRRKKDCALRWCGYRAVWPVDAMAIWCRSLRAASDPPVAWGPACRLKLPTGSELSANRGAGRAAGASGRPVGSSASSSCPQASCADDGPSSGTCRGVPGVAGTRRAGVTAFSPLSDEYVTRTAGPGSGILGFVQPPWQGHAVFLLEVFSGVSSLPEVLGPTEALRPKPSACASTAGLEGQAEGAHS